MRFHLPPLRERREEILPLVDHFLTRECSQTGKPVPPRDEAVEHLLLHRWPGNIRQLYNEMRRIAATIDPGVPITPGDPRPRNRRRAPRGDRRRHRPEPGRHSPRSATPARPRNARARHDHHALAHSDGHLETAARRSSVSRKGLFLKRQRLEIA